MNETTASSSRPSGLFDERYTTFLRSVAPIRARLHAYCARMTGSAMNGEDVVQESLIEAYLKLDQLSETAALQRWLFRIGHNRSVDFVRRRQAQRRAEAYFGAPEVFVPPEPVGRAADHAIEHLVLHLPPKERACVLLKDVFDYSLEETSELVGTTTGAVKAALHRGRSKLEALSGRTSRQQPERKPIDPATRRLIKTYVDLFNRRDWEAIRDLASADAQLTVHDHFQGRLADAPYFDEYQRAETQWRLETGELEGEPVLIMLNQIRGDWRPVYPVRISVRDGHITEIFDYLACPWVFENALFVPSIRG